MEMGTLDRTRSPGQRKTPCSRGLRSATCLLLDLSLQVAKGWTCEFKPLHPGRGGVLSARELGCASVRERVSFRLARSAHVWDTAERCVWPAPFLGSQFRSVSLFSR